MRAGESLSLQFHREKDESWYVESGRARLELGEAGQEALDEEVVTAGACFRYRPGTVHRVTALEDTTILEVSTPHLDDVVRLEDRYGREGTSERLSASSAGTAASTSATSAGCRSPAAARRRTASSCAPTGCPV